MTKRVALMLPLAVAAAVTHTRRATLKHTAYAVAAAAAPASARALLHEEEFCRISDEQSKNGIEFGCKQYVAISAARAAGARARRDYTGVGEARHHRRDGGERRIIRGALRRDLLDGLRAQGGASRRDPRPTRA